MTTLTLPHPTAGERLRGLRRWNTGLSALHLFQGLAIFALARLFSLPVTSLFLRMDTATDMTGGAGADPVRRVVSFVPVSPGSRETGTAHPRRAAGALDPVARRTRPAELRARSTAPMPAYRGREVAPLPVPFQPGLTKGDR